MVNTSCVLSRVATLVGPRQIEIRERSVGEVGPSQVLVRTLFSGISAGTEMNVYRGDAAQWHTRQDPETGLFEPTDTPEWSYPLVYGYAAVGRIEQAGSAVPRSRLGELVFTYSPHTSHTVVDADDAIPLPELDDPRIGVLNANLNTAYNGVLDANPALGDVVVVSGLGVIGLMVVQLLVRSGARVIAVDGIERRRELAARFGAEFTFSPSEGVAEKVRVLTANRGADIVIEVSGAAPALGEAIRAVGYCGTVVTLSWYGGSFESLSLSGEFHHNRPKIISSQVGGLSPALGPLWSLKRRQEIVGELLGTLELAPLITHELPLEEAPEAYRLIDAHDESLVQCVLSY